MDKNPSFRYMWDMVEQQTITGDPGERPQADEQIAQVALPQADPVYGRNGQIFQWWA